MKITLSTQKAIDMMLEDQDAAWSYNAAEAIIEWEEKIEFDSGTETEFDPAELRGIYSEHPTAMDACEEYGVEIEDGDYGEREDNALDALRDETTVIEFNGGVIVQSF